MSIDIYCGGCDNMAHGNRFEK